MSTLHSAHYSPLATTIITTYLYIKSQLSSQTKNKFCSLTSIPSFLRDQEIVITKISLLFCHSSSRLCSFSFPLITCFLHFSRFFSQEGLYNIITTIKSEVAKLVKSENCCNLFLLWRRFSIGMLAKKWRKGKKFEYWLY